MTFPTVRSTAESSTNTAGTSHTVTMPAGITVGDIVLVLMDKGTPASTGVFNALEGWTELVDENVASGLAIFAHQGNGSEGANVVMTSTVSIRSAEITYCISGAEPISRRAPELSTVATGTSATPASTIVTPTGGAKDYLWISMVGMAGEEADDDTWGNTPPSTPSAFTPSPPLQKSCGTAGTSLGGLVLAARLASNAASMTPGSFGVDVSAAWRAFTIAVHPAIAQAPPPEVEMAPRVPS